jgi:hypothetical protein
MRQFRTVRVVVVVVVWGLLAALGSPVGPASAGQPVVPTAVQFVHGIGTEPGDNPADFYIAEEGATDWDLVGGGPIAYTEILELGVPAAAYSFLLCVAVADPAETVESCPAGDVNAGGAEVAVPDTSDVVVVAGYGPPEGDPEITLDAFEVDLTCTFFERARYQVAHAAAMTEVTLFVDSQRDDRDPIGHGESVIADVRQGGHELSMLTVPDEFFALVESVEAPGAETTFLAMVGPGDPTPLDPETTDLRFVPIAFQVEPCPDPTTTSTTSTTSTTTSTTAVPPLPPAPPQPEPPDFTG